MLGAGTYRGRLGPVPYETGMPRAGEVIGLGGHVMQTQYPYQTLTLGAARQTQYPYQTLTLGRSPVPDVHYGGGASVGVHPYAGTRGLGQTGEEIDAAEAPQRGERLFYKRQAEGDFVGAGLGALIAGVYLGSRGARRHDPTMRAITGAGLPVVGMLIGRAIRQRMPRGYATA